MEVETLSQQSRVKIAFECQKFAFPTNFKTDDPELIKILGKAEEISGLVAKIRGKKDQNLFGITKYSYIYGIEAFLVENYAQYVTESSLTKLADYLAHPDCNCAICIDSLWPKETRSVEGFFG